jgi:O-antigen ligase
LVPALLRRLEVCGAFLGLLLLTNGIERLLFPGSTDLGPSDPNRLVRALYWCFYGFTALQLVIRRTDFAKYAMRAPFPVAMVGLALLSMSWSIDPHETLRRTFGLGMATLFGLYLALRFDRRELLRLVATVFGTCAVSSVAFALLVPSAGIGTGTYEGNWQGIFDHKNTLGGLMVLAAVTFRSVPGRSRASRLLGWTGVGLAAALVVLSRSMTALVVLTTMALTMPVLRRFRQRRLRSAFAIIGVGVVCATVFLGTTELTAAFTVMGRDATLTGRTEIWSAVADRIAEGPKLGYGYGAFWSSTGGPGERVRQVLQWNAPTAHNGFLDFAADLGVLGALLLLGALIHAGYRAWVRWRPDLGVSDDWMLAIVIASALVNLTESFLYGTLFAPWVLLVAATAVRADGLATQPATSPIEKAFRPVPLAAERW